MAAEEDVLPICTELCERLGVPLPQIELKEIQLAFFKVPTKLINGKLELSPTTVATLSCGQLRVVLAYALTIERRSAALMKRMQVVTTLLAVLVAAAYIFAFEMKNPKWTPAFWIMLAISIIVICAMTFGWSYRAGYVADRDVLKLTSDILGIQEYIQAGGYYRKAATGEWIKPKEKWTRKRLAALQTI